MDDRLAPVPVVAAFAGAVGPVADVVGFYAGGSLAAGDYHPRCSDLDLVAVIRLPLERGRRKRLRDLHRATRAAQPAATRLHCVYVPVGEAADLQRPHLTWAHGELYHRPLSGIARAELLQGGITVTGPPPSTYLPEVTRPALEQAARAELTGYWTDALHRPRVWLKDVYVDLALLTLARVETTLTEGRLITKREALTRLDRFGVSDRLVADIARRRDGETVPLGPGPRVRQAYTAHRLVTAGIKRLTDEPS